MKPFRKIYLYQGEPIRLAKNGYGLYIWKWAGAYFPEITLGMGGYRRGISINHVFHNGRGFDLWFHNSFWFQWAYKGKIGWWKEYKLEYNLFGIKRISKQ